jgi:putative chitinase
MIDRHFFFDSIRVALFDGVLKQYHVDGMNVIIDEWEGRYMPSDLRLLAYPLGTTYHETSRTMQPIHEYGGDAYFTRLYDITGDFPLRAKRYGNVHPGDGIKYHGRGFVQLTWYNNYKAMEDILDQPLTAKPDLALLPNIAAPIMFEGMARGTFTGRRLLEFFDTDKNDPVGARTVINGTDHCYEIANYHKAFLTALQGENDAALS